MCRVTKGGGKPLIEQGVQPVERFPLAPEAVDLGLRGVSRLEAALMEGKGS